MRKNENKNNSICRNINSYCVLPFDFYIRNTKQKTTTETNELRINESFFQQENTTEEIITEETNASITNKLTTIITKDFFDADEIISISFDSTNVVEYYYITEDISVSNENTESMQFEILPYDEFGCIDVYAEYVDGQTVKKSIYTYSDGESVYISELSKDFAWRDCMKSKYEQGLITEEEIEKEYSYICEKYLLTEEVSHVDSETVTNDLITPSADANIASTSSPTTVYGTLYWTLKDGTVMPLKYTDITLYDERMLGGFRKLADATTDANGCYSFVLTDSESLAYLETGDLDIYIKIHLRTDTITVGETDNGFFYPYSFNTSTQNLAIGSTIICNYTLAYNESFANLRAIYIQQGMLIGERFAKEMDMQTTSQIYAEYPAVITGADGACCFTLNSDTGIYTALIGWSAFNDIDTLIHEYGHFVQNVMGSYGISIIDFINYKPKHEIGTDHFEDKDDKEYAMMLTWSESWATVFSQIAQRYYQHEYSLIPNFADLYDSFSVDGFIANPYSCEAQEKAVTAFLWDLYDTSSDEVYDNIRLSFLRWWEYTNGEGIYTLTDFVEFMENEHPEMRSDIGALLGAHQIAPSNLAVTNAANISAVTPPSLSWKVNGSQYNPNNRFDIAIYDNDGNFLNSTPYITSYYAYDMIYSYTIPSTVWNTLIRNYQGPQVFFLAVRGYHSEAPISGPYTSKLVRISVDLPTAFVVRSYDRYTEKTAYLMAGDSQYYRITFKAGGYKLFQTFGEKDTKLYLYNTNGTLLASDDDSGYEMNALKSYNVTANTEYILKVQFYNSNTVGNIKLGILPISESISTYEDILNPSEFWGSSLSSLDPGSVELHTYSVSNEKTRNIQVFADYDAFLYVIDPRSTDRVKVSTESTPTTPSIYDDDSNGNLNPQLTKTFEADVPYLIVVCAYAPDEDSGVYQIILTTVYD